jgi:hypothetical protein
VVVDHDVDVIGVVEPPVSPVISRVHVFEAKRPNRRYLGDVLAGPRPVEVRGAARQHDHGARRICLKPLAVEVFAQADVEDARDYRIDAILQVPLRHQLDARGHLDPDHVRARLGRHPDHNGEPGRRRERRERLPFNVLS